MKRLLAFFKQLFEKIQKEEVKEVPVTAPPAVETPLDPNYVEWRRYQEQLKETGKFPTTSEHREGMVAVHPTGVLGKGITHWYPAPDPQENIWGYITRLARTKNPENNDIPYVSPNLVGAYVLMQSTMPKDSSPQEQADRLQYQTLWDNQEEVDRKKAAETSWGTYYNAVQERESKPVPKKPTPNNEVEVIIPEEE